MHHSKKYQEEKIEITEGAIQKNQSDRTREALICIQKFQSKRFLQENLKKQKARRRSLIPITIWLL